MLEAISKCKTGETTAIGKFHGFELLVEKNFLGINYMVLRGKTEYKAELSTSPVGSMVKLENLFNGLHENIDFLEKKIEQYQNDLEASKTEYDKPFAYSKELEEKLARQCELNAQLDLENAKAVDADLSLSLIHILSPLMSYSRETLSSTVLQATEDIRTSAMWQYMSEMARW